jgi:23S rRNA pseudouridine955/2504/2580 synthase
MNLKTGPDDSGRRLDRILRKALPDYPLSLIHRLLRQRRVLVDGKPAKPQDHVPQDAQITIPGDPPRPAERASTQSANKPAPLPSALDILWQGSGLLVINKPAGIAVHGPDSLDTQVQHYHTMQVSPHEEASLSFRPGPLHRLDKPTSGAIVFSSNLVGAQRFSALLQEGKINKFYLAIVEGRLEKAEIWQDHLDRKTQGTVNVHTTSKYLEMKNEIKPTPMSQGSSLAISSVSPLTASEGKDKYTLILAQIHTGKTHQIRAQAAAHGHPLAGDIKYGGHIVSGNLNGQGHFRENFFLHAWKIEIDETITAPPPESFLRQVKSIFGKELDAIVSTLFQRPCAGII